MPFNEVVRYGFYGALIFQMAFIFVLFLQNKDKPYYIYYAFYVFGILLAIEPRLHGFGNAFVFLIEMPTTLFYFLFLDSFLTISKSSKSFKVFITYFKYGIFVFIGLQILFTTMRDYIWPSVYMTQIVGFLDDTFFYAVFVAGAYALYETYNLKNTISKYILAGTFALLIGVILNRLFYVPLNVAPVIIGTFLELLFFSAALGYTSNLAELEKSKAQEQLMKTTLIALRDQMSPHFIANCLNSIKFLIQQGNDKKAIEYLSEFSKLHRLIVEHFQDLKISLKKELTICRSYLEMEKLRFKEVLNYEFDICIDDNLLSFVEVPPLLFQPIIENAIWHGLTKKKGPKKLMIRVENMGEYIRCIIEDNGVGRPNQETPNRQTQGKKSTGLSNTYEKIKVHNRIYHTQLELQLMDKYDDKGQPGGLKVIFKIFYD